MLAIAKGINDAKSTVLGATCNKGRFANTVDIAVSVTGRTTIAMSRYCEVHVDLPDSPASGSKVPETEPPQLPQEDETLPPTEYLGS